jgi:Protein kinase domain
VREKHVHAVDQGLATDHAIQRYVQTRRFEEAGRLAYNVGRFREAGAFFNHAALWMEAATSFLKAGERAQCLDALTRTSQTSSSYPQVCRRAIGLVYENGSINFALDQFLSRYLTQPPRDDADVDAFVMAGKTYERARMNDTSIAVFKKVLIARPGHQEATLGLALLQQSKQKNFSSKDMLVLDVVASQVPRQRAGARTVTEVLMPLPELSALPSGRSATPQGALDKTFAKNNEPLVLSPGVMLAGRYRIERMLGEGGMGAVYKAHDMALDEEIAVKIIRSETSEHLARFKKEIAISRRITHPNVIRLYDYGSVQTMHFLTMEVLNGRSLEDCTKTPLDFRSGIQILIQCCLGLGAAHAHGTVHRDIKPANFMLLEDGTVKLVDFGIAKHAASGSPLTITGFIAGTPHYMSPEQINNFKNADARSDLYSLGVMAFEMFTGAVPFDHDNLLTVLQMHMYEVPPRVSSVRPDISPALDEIIDQLLAKNPDHRFASCEALSRALHAALNDPKT